MDDYDIWNGLAVAGPVVFLLGLGLIYVIGKWMGLDK